MDKKEIMERVKADDVKFISFQFSDVTGKVKKEVEQNANREEINLAEPKAPGATVSEKETVQPKQSQPEAQKQEENQPPKPVGKQPIPSFMQQ